jgi:hypothetical protein
MNKKKRTRKKIFGVGETMEGKFWNVFGAEDQRSIFSCLNNGLLCEFHCKNKLLLLFFVVVFLALSSLEFPNSDIPVTCARETLINEWVT